MRHYNPRETFENLSQLIRFGLYLYQNLYQKCLLLYLINDIISEGALSKILRYQKVHFLKFLRKTIKNFHF